MKKFIFLTLLITSFSTTYGQIERHLGFKTGLTFAHPSGPLQTGETWKNLTGFHLGMAMDFNFSDHFGVRGELLFNRRGGKFEYDGPSYFIFKTDAGSKITQTDTANWVMNVSNSYFELPVLAFVKVGKLEFSAGPTIGVLVGSTADGIVSFRGKNTVLNGFSRKLSYNFNKDKAGEGGTETDTRLVNGQSVTTSTTLGAYQQLASTDGHLFNTLDLGLEIGASFYLNRSLYLGFRFHYGLSDITRNTTDRDLSKTDGQNGPVFSSDFDRNYGFSGSVGFSF